MTIPYTTLAAIAVLALIYNIGATNVQTTVNVSSAIDNPYPQPLERPLAVVPSIFRIRKRLPSMYWRMTLNRHNQLSKLKSKVYRRQGWHRERGQLWNKAEVNTLQLLTAYIIAMFII